MKALYRMHPTTSSIGKVCLLLLCLIFLPGNSPLFAQTMAPPLVQRGSLDLRDWNFEQSGAVVLNGEWEFYWQQFLQPFQLESTTLHPDYLTVPSSWPAMTLHNSRLSGDGYATYHLTINLAPGDTGHKALKLPAIYTSYQMWVNGHPVSSKGALGTSRQDMKPQSAPTIVHIMPENGKIDLVIQVANFYHIKGGIRNELWLGTPEQIAALREHALNLQMVLLGGMLIIGIYYLVHYIFRRKEQSSLYFGLFCLVISLRLLLVGESAIFNLLPNIDWSLVKRLEYAGLYSAVPLFGLFIYHLYPPYISRRILSGFLILCTFLVGLALLTPPKIYMSPLNLYQVLVALAIIYYTYILYLAARDKQESAYLSAFAGFIFLLTVLNDILYYNNIIHTYDGLFALGFLVFILSQSVILSKRFSIAINEAEELSLENAQMIKEITELNRSLEDRISQRTAQLNEIIEILNKEISERSEAEKKLRIYATTDLMTGLANRATGMNTLDSQLSAAMRNLRPLTVGFIDIDNLKVVNDDFGHQIGDDLIINISMILQKNIRQYDTVSRIGGDEFLIVFPDCTLQGAKAIWERVEEGIAQFNEAQNKPYQISVSHGFAEYTPGEDITAQELVEIADCQMYRFKKPYAV